MEYREIGLGNGYKTKVAYPPYFVNIDKEDELLVKFLELIFVSTTGLNCIITGLECIKHSPTEVRITKGKCVIGGSMISVLSDVILPAPEIPNTTTLFLHAYRDATTFCIRFAVPQSIKLYIDRYLYLGTAVISNSSVTSVVMDPELRIDLKQLKGSNVPPELERQIVTGIAYEPILSNRVVKVVNNLVTVADYRDLSYMHALVGISLNDATIGQEVKVLTKGCVSDRSWSLNPSLPVTLGENGLITQYVSDTGQYLNLGRVINETTFYVDVEKPILRG